MATNNQTAPEELGYEAAVAELDSIVAELDRSSVDVDTLSEKFQRAIDIIENLDKRIAKTEAQVKKLAPRLEALTNAKAEPAPE